MQLLFNIVEFREFLRHLLIEFHLNGVCHLFNPDLIGVFRGKKIRKFSLQVLQAIGSGPGEFLIETGHTHLHRNFGYLPFSFIILSTGEDQHQEAEEKQFFRHKKNCEGFNAAHTFKVNGYDLFLLTKILFPFQNAQRMQTEKVIEYITQWLKDYAETSKTNGFVVGISGGIDSAVVSALCAKTGKRTLCVEIPIHQAPTQVNRAQNHILDLKKRFSNVTDIHVDLTQVFEQFRSSVPHLEETDALNLSLANTRARLRMTTLYYFAGIHGLLVTGTGNKVEDFGVGFFTKYGDGGVDISPIADLMKSQVYELAEQLNISDDIMKAAPTDGLFGDSRTDEDQIGASYDELEWAMERAEENKNATDFSGREREVFNIFMSRNQANKHKMEPIPVCKIPVHLI